MTDGRPHPPGSAGTDPGLVRARLHDPPGGPARTTATLVASLRDRWAALRAMSGADAVGSLVAGYAAVGRDAARAAEGRRLAQALRAGRPGVNGAAVWSALGIDRMAQVPPSPVLDHLRNDLALLLADDLDAALRAPPGAGRPTQQPGGGDRAPVDDVDYLVGMWAFSRELVAAVEALAAATSRTAGTVVDDGAQPLPPEGPLLR